MATIIVSVVFKYIFDDPLFDNKNSRKKKINKDDNNI